MESHIWLIGNSRLKFLHQTGLADTGLAGDQYCLPFAGLSPLPAAHEISSSSSRPISAVSPPECAASSVSPIYEVP